MAVLSHRDAFEWSEECNIRSKTVGMVQAGASERAGRPNKKLLIEVVRYHHAYGRNASVEQLPAPTRARGGKDNEEYQR